MGSALTEAENWDLFADCTSRDGRIILDTGIHLSDKRTMSMGFTNIAKEDAQTVSNTIQHIISESASSLTNGEETTDSTNFKMLSTLSCLLSDCSSVMKKSNTLFNEWRENLLKENIPDMELSSLFLIYCSAHMLLGFHTSVNSTLKQLSPTQNDVSEAVRTIRIVCGLFGPRGDERTVEEKTGYAI